MKRGKESPTIRLLRKSIPYIILIGIVLAIFTSGFVVGRITVPTVPVDKPDTIATPTATVSESVVEIDTIEDPIEEEVWIDFIATAYCPCEKCCGVWATKRPLDDNGNPIVYGASGIVLRQGVSVAADTSIYPMGTQLEIDGIGTYTVHDVGGGIKGNRLDVYFDNHEDALVFGRKTVRVREVK